MSLINMPTAYNNNPVQVIRSKKIRDRNMRIFLEYSLKYKTVHEISRERGMNPGTIRNAIRWAAVELNTGDKDIYTASALTSLNKELKELDNIETDATLIRDKVNVKNSKIKFINLKAKIQGIIQPDVEVGDKTVNVYFSDFTKVKKPGAKVIEAKEEDGNEDNKILVGEN